MADFNLTQEMEKHVMLMALAANHSDSEVISFLNVDRFFVFKVR